MAEGIWNKEIWYYQIQTSTVPGTGIVWWFEWILFLKKGLTYTRTYTRTYTHTVTHTHTHTHTRDNVSFIYRMITYIHIPTYSIYGFIVYWIEYYDNVWNNTEIILNTDGTVLGVAGKSMYFSLSFFISFFLAKNTLNNTI